MNRTLTLIAIGMAAVLAGCPKMYMPPTQASNLPAWVDRGAGVFADGAGAKAKAFYGVGASTGVQDVSLRRDDADVSARVDLARTFKTNVKNLLKAYRRSVGTAERGQEERLIQNATKAFTEADIAGVPIIERFYDPVSKTQYSLAKMDLQAFKNQVEQMKALSAEAAAAIKANADRAFSELDEASAKAKVGESPAAR